MLKLLNKNLDTLSKQPKYADLYRKIQGMKPDFVGLSYSLDEADAAAERKVKELVLNESIESLRSIVLLGLEWGTLAARLLRIVPARTAVLILEQNPNAFYEAMTKVDLTEVLTSSSIFLFVHEQEQFESELLGFLSNNFYFITHRVLFLENPVLENEQQSHFYRTAFANARYRYQMRLGNSPEDTLIGNLHNALNLKIFMKSPPLSILKAKYKNVPAVCIAAGPSLEKNLHLLKGKEDKILIFACDTIMERLQKSGIRPHFVSSLERNKEIYDYFFKNKSFPDETVLLGLSLLYPTIFEEFKGGKIAVSRAVLSFEHWLSRAIPTVEPVAAGQSVAHLNYSVARSLGCNPIILIGQDLAYGENGHTHAKGTYDELEEFASTNGVVDFGVPKLTTKGYYGQEVETQHIWNMFRKWFEDEIRMTDGLCINATEGGAYIQGALHQSLEEVLQGYGKLSIEHTPYHYVKEYDIPVEKQQQTEKKVLDQFSKQLELNQNIKSELLDLEAKLSEIPNKAKWDRNKKELVNRFQQIYNEFLQKVYQEENMMNTIQFVLFNVVSKINRVAVIDQFQQVETICAELKGLIRHTVHYLDKMAEIYAIGLKVLTDSPVSTATT